jgi:hypothetical protein
MKGLIIFSAGMLICVTLLANNRFSSLPQVKQLKQKYNINFVTDSFNGGEYALSWASWTTPEESDSTDFIEFIRVFSEEWNKYPLAWIQVNKLKNIVFVKNLKVTHQLRFAMPDPYDETLYYDMEYLIYGEEYVREMIHHEFWHDIEEQQFGDMYYKNSTWCSYNIEGFKYGSGGSTAYDDGEYTYGEHPRKGFVTTYSVYGEEEDRAELYCWFFTSRTWNLLTTWIIEDRVLRKKYNWMLSFISGLVPEMNVDYFKKINTLED